MWIDLSRSIFDDMPVYEGDPKVHLKQIASLDKDGYVNHELTINMHAGTHIDGLLHMQEIGQTIDLMPLSDLIGKARFVSDETPYINQGETMLIVRIENVSLNELFVKDVIKSKIKVIVIEQDSPDQYPYLIHKKLFEHKILLVENAVNFDQLKLNHFYDLYVIPLKIVADSSPVRCFVNQI